MVSSVLMVAALGLGLLGPVAAVRCETDSARVARLFVWASAGSVRYVEMVDPAKDSIAAMGENGARWLVGKLGSTDARQRHTLADIFERLGAVAVPFVIPYLDSSGESMPKNAARALGRIGDSSAVPDLVDHLGHAEYSVRSEVATACGKLGDRRAVTGLIARLALEPDPDVRKSCVVALGVLADTAATAILIDRLADPFFGVRQAATRSLPKLRPAPVESLLEAVASTEGRARHGAIVALGGCDHKKARRALLKLLGSDDPFVRGFAIEALWQHPDRAIGKRLRKLRKTETNLFVLAQLDRYDREQ
jgi:HEAT repeat protein